LKQVHPQSERRSKARYPVDTEACLVSANHGRSLTGRMLELSLDGCRVRANRECPQGMPEGVEVLFKINGIAFRLAGTMQWMDARRTAGIRFKPMASRRRAALEELLAELEAEEQARAAIATPSTNEPEPLRPIQISETAPNSEEESSAAPPEGRERRSCPRQPVDTGATVLFIDLRTRVSGRILDVSMSGCRIRIFERFQLGIYRRVEAEFKVDGLSFRLAGVVQALHDRFTVGIRFLDMSDRKRDQLAQLMEEIEEMRTENPAQEAADAVPTP
jgi:hypothetical protein